MGASSTESKQFAGIAANTGTFGLKGGNYMLAASRTITSVQLQVLSLDGSTWINLGTALSSAGNQSYSLPPATYRLAVTGSAIYASISSVPT
jgi:hypothetical protein